MLVKIIYSRGCHYGIEIHSKKTCFFLVYLGDNELTVHRKSFVFFVFPHTKFVLSFPTLRYSLDYYDFWIGPLQFLADLQQSLNSANANEGACWSILSVPG